MQFSSTTIKRSLAAAAAASLLTVSLAACGSDDSSTAATSTESSSSSSSETQAAPKPVAAIDNLTGVSTQITLDQGFVDALGSLMLTPAPTGDATLENGAITFPITGGNVTYFKPGTVSPYVIGQIQHVGSGLSLTAGQTKVTLSNFNVDPGVSRVYGDVDVNGKRAATSAYLFTLDGRTLMPLQTEGSNAILEGTKVEISPVAADLLNSTFNTDAVAANLLVGIAKITVATGS